MIFQNTIYIILNTVQLQLKMNYHHTEKTNYLTVVYSIVHN